MGRVACELHERRCFQRLRCHIWSMFRGGHELWSHGVLYALREDRIYVGERLIVQMPSKNVFQRIQFSRMRGTPQAYRDSRLIEHPAHCQDQHVLAVTLVCILVEDLHSLQVLRESWR